MLIIRQDEIPVGALQAICFEDVKLHFMGTVTVYIQLIILKNYHSNAIIFAQSLCEARFVDALSASLYLLCSL